jgi:hypothetical protein
MPRISLVHLIVFSFSSQLSLQLDLFVLFVVPEASSPAWGIVTPHSLTALLSIMSLYYLNEFHACLPSFCTGA